MSTARGVLALTAALALSAEPAAATPPFVAAARRLPPAIQRCLLGGDATPALIVRGAAVTWTTLAPAALDANPLPSSALSVGATLLPGLDQSRRAVGADLVHDREGLTGRGVIVAVVDTGIDVRHQDFREADGRTRVAWLLDLSRPPRAVHAGLEARFGLGEGTDRRGAVWSRDDLDAALRDPMASLPEDEVGHGTYVASIAAGNGRATGRGLAPGRYAGIAPEATLVVVRASAPGQPQVSDATVAAGVAFAFDRAEALGQPVVLNLSVGTHRGPHDGGSALERALTSFVPDAAAARAIVVSAGNDGDRPVHARIELVPGSLEALALELPPGRAEGPADVLGVELVCEGRVTIALRGVDGVTTGFVAPGTAGGFSMPSGLASIANATDGADPVTGLRIADVLVAAGGDGRRARAGGRYEILLRGEGRVDGWVFLDGTPRPIRERPRFAPECAVSYGTVTSPATAPGLVAVGSLASRDAFPDARGMLLHDPSVVPGVVSVFSARGPNRRNDPRPDLLAPGELVLAALSHGARAGGGAFDLERVADDGEHVAGAGTSSAAPHVTGAMALLLEADPTLSQRELVAALAGSARGIAGGGARWNLHEAWGAIDLPAALALVRARRGARQELDPARSELVLTAPVVTPGESVVVALRLVTRAGTAATGPHEVRVRVSRGLLEPPRDEGGGRYTARCTARGVGVGEQIVVGARVDGVELAPRILAVARDPTVRGEPSAEAGCAVRGASRSGAPEGGGELLAWVLIARARRGGRRSRWRSGEGRGRSLPRRGRAPRR